MAHRPGGGQPPQASQQPYGQQWSPQQTENSWGQQYTPQDQQWQPTSQVAVPYAQQQYPQPQSYPQQQGAAQYLDQPRRHAYGLTAAQRFWYVLSCIPFGAGYFAKIPAKKAMSDFGLATLTGAEAFWYILMCVPFGAGYFAKLSTAKALSELDQFRL
jgi:hypothetical protein